MALARFSDLPHNLTGSLPRPATLASRIQARPSLPCEGPDRRTPDGREQAFSYFAAYVGLTKHLGGASVIDALAQLCHIGPGSCVLDVDCGAGATPCYLARKYDCRVMGVDIKEQMVERSREQAIRQGVADRVEFRVADA